MIASKACGRLSLPKISVQSNYSNLITVCKQTSGMMYPYLEGGIVYSTQFHCQMAGILFSLYSV